MAWHARPVSLKDDLAAVWYSHMRWNTPLSDEHAELLLRRLDIPDDASVLDLGCGWGELLLRAVATGSGTTGVGVDTDEVDLSRGRRLATARSLDRRVTFVNGDAATWREPADRVLCVGAEHAFGGSAGTLDAIAGLLRPGGRLLLGAGCWERPPTAEARAVLGDNIPSLTDLVELFTARGWRVLHLSTADQREWDDFESTWRAGRQEWLLAHPDAPDAGELREFLDARLREYVGVYRGTLGLAYAVLAR